MQTTAQLLQQGNCANSDKPCDSPVRQCALLVAVEELPADGFKVVTGRENHPGQGVFTAVWNRLEALRMRGNLIRSLRADRLNPNNPQEQPASLQVKLLRLYPTTRTTTRQVLHRFLAC